MTARAPATPADRLVVDLTLRLTEALLLPIAEAMDAGIDPNTIQACTEQSLCDAIRSQCLSYASGDIEAAHTRFHAMLDRINSFGCKRFKETSDPTFVRVRTDVRHPVMGRA